MISGAILIDKESGVTSRAVVNAVQRRFGVRDIGHGGTLDPLATGLLVLLCGHGKRLQDLIFLGMKDYEGVIRLGISTDTDDITGVVLERDEELRFARGDLGSVSSELVSKFIGTSHQVPPDYSAIKVSGKRAYQRARAGETLNLSPREITIDELSFHFLEPTRLSYYARVSQGTYIRSLARDIGKYLGTFGCIESIRRTTIGPLSIENARKVQQLQDTRSIEEAIVPVDDLVKGFSRLNLNNSECGLFRNGNQGFLTKYKESYQGDSFVAVFDECGKLNGLLEQFEGELRIRCVL